MHILAFIGLTLTALFTPGWLFLVLCAVYLWYYTGYEIFLITVCIDIQFGTGGLIAGAWYTLMFTMVFICMNILKPNLSFRA